MPSLPPVLLRRRSGHTLVPEIRSSKAGWLPVMGGCTEPADQRSFGAQAELGDLALAVEADWRIRESRAGAGVAPHLAVAPQPGIQVPVARQMGDQRPAARQAQLPAVAVAAQIQAVAGSGRLPGHL